MKQLFTIACTLVLGSALGFAQATTQPTPASGDQTQTKTTTTKKHHKHGAKKTSKKAKKGAAETTPAPAASPSPK